MTNDQKTDLTTSCMHSLYLAYYLTSNAATSCEFSSHQEGGDSGQDLALEELEARSASGADEGDPAACSFYLGRWAQSSTFCISPRHVIFFGFGTTQFMPRPTVLASCHENYSCLVTNRYALYFSPSSRVLPACPQQLVFFGCASYIRRRSSSCMLANTISSSCHSSHTPFSLDPSCFLTSLSHAATVLYTATSHFSTMICSIASHPLLLNASQ